MGDSVLGIICIMDPSSLNNREVEKVVQCERGWGIFASSDLVPLG